MRQLNLSKPTHAETPEGIREQTEQTESLLLSWAALGSVGLTPEASALQPFINGNARFVASLAKQYQNKGVSQETLVAAAHEALITVLNQYAHCLDKLNKVLVPALRNAMLTTIQAQTGQSV